MSTTTKNVGRVSIVPKGDWNINNTYIHLDLVTYDGNSYIAKKDVPKNIQLSNNNYWMLMASKGASFAIVKSYASIAAMNADFSNTNVQNGQFVIIDTGNVQDPDNAKLYYKGSNSYVFVTDMSGATGIQGPRGASAYEQAVAGGYTGTEAQFNEDLANFSELSEQAADSAAAAARSESNAAGSATTATTKAGEATDSAAQALASMNSADASAQAAANSATSAELNSSTAFEFAKQAASSKSAAALCVREAQGQVREAQAYAIGKRDDIDVSITDQAYHNNAKYYAEQAALVVNNVEQTMTATTIDSVTLATFNASIADMPFKELTIDIEPVQTAGTPSPETPLPITGQTGCNIYHSQYNLIDQSIVTNATNWAVSTDTEFSDYNGAPVFKGAISNLYNKFNYYSKRIPVKVQPGKRYVFRLWWRSVDANTNNGLRMRLWYDDQTYTDSSPMTANQTWKSITLISDTNKTPAGIGFLYNYNYSIYLAGLMCVDYEQYMALGSDQTTFVCPNDRQTYSITFPSEAGTVYGGTLDVVGKKLTVDRAFRTYAASEVTAQGTNTGRFNIPCPTDSIDSGKWSFSSAKLPIADRAKADLSGSVNDYCIYKRYATTTYTIKLPVTALEEARTILDGLEICYYLARPLVYDLTDIPNVLTLIGTNNIWADTGDVTVTYGAYLETVKAYADQAADSAATAEAVLASIPDDYTELNNKINNLNTTFFAEYGVTTFNEIDTQVKDGNLVVLKQDGLLSGGSYYTVLSGTSFGEVAGFPWSGYIFTKPAVAFGDTVSYTRITCGSDNEWTTENSEVRNINTDIVGTFYYANAYKVGDYVQQNKKIYKFIAPHTAGSYWNTSEVVEVVLTNEIDKISEDVAELRSAIDKNNSVNILDNVAVSTSTTNGITFSVIDTQTINVAGTSTALANKDIYSSQTMPEWLEKGKQYYLEYSTPSGNVLFRVYIYRNGTLVSTALVEAVSNQVFTIPTDATGIIFRLAVKKSLTVNENVTFAVLNAKSNLQLSNNIENLSPVILTTNSADAHNETINLLNPNTITEGYVLSNNIPVANSSFYYSDYIEIGMNRFCFSQVGSVSGQVNCYDFNKNYIGTIDYGKNTDHFEEGNVGADTNLRFRTFTPLDGTVYIRVCGGINRPKMVTPFFSPMDYGAKAQNLPYLQTFHKWGLNAAMFGDSIMLGRDGNSSAILEKNSVWWVNQLTNLNADNFGVGSMGWVSTRYLSEIAYDKISTTDITGYDLIVLCYGVNDTGSTLGSWDSTDETTIMGQVNKCIRYIGSVNPSARIILIAPWNTPGSGTFPDWGYSVQRYGGLTRYDLSNSLKRAAEYYKIGFISQIDSPLNGFGLGTAEGIANGPFAGTDGVHPTQEGYAAIGYWLSAKISAIQTESTIPSEDIANLKSAVAPEANFNFVHVISTQQPAPYNALSTVFDCGLYGVRGSEGYMPADAPAGFSGGSLLILPAYQERTTQGTPLNQTQKIQMLIDPVNKKIWMRYANASNTWRDWFVADMSMPVTALATATPNANGFTSSSFVAGGISEAGGNSSNSHRIRSVYIAKDDKTSIRYAIPDGYRLQIAFYSNNSGTQVGRTNWITGDGRIGFPEGCNYFRLQFASIDDATDLTSAADYNRISIEYGYELIDYSPFITTQTRWLALGDSITYGVCSSGPSASSEGTSWAAFLAESLGYVFKNMGVRGMGYVTSGSNGVTWADTLDNVDALTDDYNLITILLGINDYNNSSATLDSIATALNTGITRILAKYPNARLVVFTPFNACNRGTAETLYDYGYGYPTSNPRTLKDIADKIMEVCTQRGVECHNVSNGCLLNPSNMTGLLLDTIHPSQDCHKLLSKAMARYLIY